MSVQRYSIPTSSRGNDVSNIGKDVFFRQMRPKKHIKMIRQTFSSFRFRYSLGVIPYSALKFMVKLLRELKPTA